MSTKCKMVSHQTSLQWLQIMCPYDGAIAQQFSGDDQILSSDGKEIVTPGARRTMQYH